MLNAQNGPCKDRRVRQALDYALDVDAIIAGVMNGCATRLNAYLTAHNLGSSPRSTFRVLREKLHSGLRGPWWEGYQNPQVDALIEKAQATVADADRQRIYREIYAIVRDDAPWVFLYRPTNYWGVRATMAGWAPRPDGLVLLR